MPANNYRKENLSRRRMLALSGAAGAATLAGCFGGDDEGNGNGEDGDPTDLVEGDTEEIDNDVPENYEDEFHQANPGGAGNPYDGEHIFNPYHPQWNPGDLQETSFEYLTVYNTSTGEFVPRVAEDWDIDDDLTTTVHLSDEYGWSDGESVTAEDAAAALRMEGYMQMGVEDFVDPDEGVRVEDEYTLVVEPRDEYTDLEENLWLNQWAELLLNVNADQYSDFLERFEEASEDEREAIQEDVINYAPEWNEVRYSGPFVFSEANEQYADQTPNQHHPVAQDWDLYLRYGIYEEEEGLRAGEVDWLHNDPTLQDLPDKYDEPPVSYSGQTLAIIFGDEDEYIRDYPEVRKAIAYAVDMEEIAETTAPGTPVDEYSGGIDSGYIQNFVREDVLDAMPNYAPQDTDTAQELLEDVGFELDDGQWYTPDGDEWTVNFPVGDWFTTHSEMVYNNLAEFGIDMDYYVEEMPTWQAETEPDNEFDMTIHLNYGMARQFHAYPDLDSEMTDPTRGLLTERTGIIDEEVEVPEVGNPDSDETVTLNIPEELENISTASDEEELMEHSSRLAWMHNQLLPAAMVFPWSEHYWVNAGEWDFDLESDAWTTSNRITHYLLQHGLSPE